MIFERKMLWNIYGLEVNHETNTYERIRNEELQKLYKRPNIMVFTRNKQLQWFGHTLRADGQQIKKVLIKKNKQNKTT